MEIRSQFYGAVLYILFYIQLEDGSKGPKHVAINYLKCN